MPPQPSSASCFSSNTFTVTLVPRPSFLPAATTASAKSGGRRSAAGRLTQSRASRTACATSSASSIAATAACWRARPVSTATVLALLEASWPPSLVRRERVAAEVVALGHRTHQLRRVGGQCERHRRGVADRPGGDAGRSADRDVTGVLAEPDDHQQRGADDAGRGDLGHLARRALETQRRQQRAQLAAEGLGHVLRAGGEPHVLAGLPAELLGSHHDDVGAGLGGARAPQVVRRHPPHSNHG